MSENPGGQRPPEDDPEATQLYRGDGDDDETTGQFATVAAETRLMRSRQVPARPLESGRRASSSAAREGQSVKVRRARGRINVARLAAPILFLAVVIAVLAIAVNSGVVDGSKSTGGSSTTGVPSKSPSAKPSNSVKTPKVYTVRPGDTLSAIAAKYHTTVPELQALNPTIVSTTLRVGQKIKLPQP
jgi:LysM repeat protein